MAKETTASGGWPLGKGVRVAARDGNGLAALAKPAGLLSHPNGPRDRSRSLLTAAYDPEAECYHWTEDGDGRRVYLLNRLDSATSGIVLCAEDAAVAEAVRALFAAGQVEKTYFALVFGVMAPSRQIWKDRLGVRKEQGKLRTSAGEGGHAETAVRLVRAFPARVPVSLLEMQPRTGRTHQLRVQCAKRKLPIIGDQTYGQFSWNRDYARLTGLKRLFLHSAAVSLVYEVDGRRQTFKASVPLPSEFIQSV